MNVLRIPHIPDGWTPGDALHVIPAQRDQPGAIVHAPNGLEAALMAQRDPSKAGDVAMVRYRYEDTPEVAHWLAWWAAHKPRQH